MKTRHTTDPVTFSRMTTQELRDTFLIDSLFRPGEIELVYWEADRTIIGSAVPTSNPIALEASQKELAADFFLQRRELGILNIGGPGSVETDEGTHALAKLDALYVGRGSKKVLFRSDSPSEPAKFYLVSYPAHAGHPTTLVRPAEANRLELGDPASANRRTIVQQIREGGARSCQLVMGFTELATGSVWNTMPPHTHQRRSEVYLYFDLPEDQAVIHLMGPGQETRHLVMRSGQVALSPIWSIHSGAGTSAYRFCWAMGGENQRFDDMDGIPVAALK
ncbi:MAG: 5-dehydro-4-deoxy-D-glucuronate isomerase [Chthoniobacterales bacterium]|nr:5-dehydro-4-deoxy-D-glucuronate isomerase [Chthoniobacterales bacterium]